MLKTVSFENFLNKMSQSLNTNIDPSSIDVKIFKTFYDLTSEISNKTELAVKSMFFENLKGDDLDTVMEFFDSYRARGGDSDIHVFNLYGKSNKSFLIKKDSILNFDDKSYRVLIDTYINQGENELLTQSYGSKVNIEQPVYTLEGSICFKSGSIESTFKNINQLFTNSVKFITYYVQNDEIESDFEFREKSKSLMQSLGLSNSQKIKYEIMKNKDVKNVIITDDADITKLTIIPYSLSKADDVLEASKETVEYYKGGNVVAEKPNVIEINIEGIGPMLVFDPDAKAVKDAVVLSVTEYLTSNFSGVVYRSKILTLIQECINSNSSINTHDVNSLNITYNYYNKDNYDVAVVYSSIGNSKVVSNNTVVTFGNMG
ncbi:MAG: hypothetical protein ACRCX2_19855 [Paraclostridium sp.]